MRSPHNATRLRSDVATRANARNKCNVKPHTSKFCNETKFSHAEQRHRPPLTYELAVMYDSKSKHCWWLVWRKKILRADRLAIITISKTEVSHVPENAGTFYHEPGSSLLTWIRDTINLRQALSSYLDTHHQR